MSEHTVSALPPGPGQQGPVASPLVYQQPAGLQRRRAFLCPPWRFDDGTHSGRRTPADAPLPALRPGGVVSYTGPSARDLAAQLPGSRHRPDGQGRYCLRGWCHGRGESRSSASLVVWDRPDGGLAVHCWAGCERRTVIEALEQASGLRIWGAWETEGRVAALAVGRQAAHNPPTPVKRLLRRSRGISGSGRRPSRSPSSGTTRPGAGWPTGTCTSSSPSPAPSGGCRRRAAGRATRGRGPW